MGGAESIRGFLCQSLVAVFDSLEDLEWNTVTVEPQNESEKVDIKWTYLNKPPRLLQVKSSTNQFTAREIKKWAEELSASASTDDSQAELQLVGTASERVIKRKEHMGVRILPPMPNDTRTIVKACAQQIDWFCSEHDLRQRSPGERELLVSLLITQVFFQSAGQITVSRSELVEQIKKWVTTFRDPSLVDASYRTLTSKPRNPYFTGRSDLLEQLANVFAEKAKLSTVAIVGLGGQGKTQVAIEFLHSAREDYKFALWLDAGSTESLSAGLATLAVSLGLISSSANAQASLAQAAVLAKEWLTLNTEWLAVVDNVETSEDLEFLLNRRGGHVLITSRVQDLQRLAAMPIEIGGLARADSIAFLKKRIQVPRLLESTDQVLDELSTELGDLPLALEQAAAYIVAKQTLVTNYLSSFRERRFALLEKSRPVHGSYNHTVATTWSLNVSAVRERNAASYDVLVYCAYLEPDGIPLDFIVRGAEDLGTNISTALAKFFLNEDRTRFDFTLLDEILEPLVNLSLVVKDMQLHLVSVHRLVQEYTRHSLKAEHGSEFRRRAIVAMSQTFLPVRSENWPICERYLHSAIALVSHASEGELSSEEAGVVLHRIGHTLETIGQYEQSLKYYKRAYSVQTQFHGQLHEATGTTLNNIGVVYARLGRHDLTLKFCRDALHIRRLAQDSDPLGVAQSTQNIAFALEQLGKLDDAEIAYREAISIYEHAGESGLIGLANCKSNYARVLEERGLSQESNRLIDEAISIVEKDPFRVYEPLYYTLLESKAVRFRDAKQYEQASIAISKCLVAIELAVGNAHPKYVEAMLVLASILSQSGDSERATKICDQALELVSRSLRTEHPLYAHCLANRAHLRDVTDDDQRVIARDEMEQALQILANSKGEQSSIFATVTNNLAYLLFRSREFNSARLYYQRALKLRVARNGTFHEDVATVYGNLAIIEAQLGNDSTAQQYFQKAIQIVFKLGIPHTRDCRQLLEHASDFFGKRSDMIVVRIIGDILDRRFPERVGDGTGHVDS